MNKQANNEAKNLIKQNKGWDKDWAKGWEGTLKEAKTFEGWKKLRGSFKPADLALFERPNFEERKESFSKFVSFCEEESNYSLPFSEDPPLAFKRKRESVVFFFCGWFLGTVEVPAFSDLEVFALIEQFGFSSFEVEENQGKNED